jgi:diacylglycerol kinase family enzyme
MRVRVIINQGGGSVQDEQLQAKQNEVVNAFARHGVDASIVFISGDEIEQEARAALDAAQSGQYDAIIAGGGDGSISAVAGVLSGSMTPLGILPLGTLNHFAKDLGVPIDIDGAVEVIAAGYFRQVDVAEINGRVFVNNSSIGLYADMVADRNQQHRSVGRSKWPAMLIASWRVIRRYSMRRLSIRAEGWIKPCKTPFVFIGNNAYNLSLFNPGRRIALDQGELSLYVINHRSRWGLLWMSARALLKRLDQERDFEMRLVKEVEILSRAPQLRVSVDGEIIKMQPPLFYRTRPCALRVIAIRTDQEEQKF